MPRGKIIAQASHALSSFVLGCFDFESFEFRQKEKIAELISEISSTEIISLSDDDFKQKDFLIQIEDHGRTVFKGVPTLTTGLDCGLELQEKFGFIKNCFEDSKEEQLSVRLVHLVNKSYARQDFNKAICDCVVLQSKHLIEFMHNKEFSKSQDFLSWAKGSFGKIVLVSDEKFIKDIESKNLNMPISFDLNNSCVIGPVNKEKLDEYTKSLKMM